MTESRQLHRSAPVENRTLDWASIRRHSEEMLASLDQRFSVSPEETARVLHARAQALARKCVRDDEAGEKLETLEFQLAEERYAIEISAVQEVRPLGELTALPGTPDFLLGIVNWRGRMVSVIDIKRLFDLPGKGSSNLNKVIVVRTADVAVGILADDIVGTKAIKIATIQPSLPTLTGIRAEYLRGVTQERLVVLDVYKLLRDPRITGDSQVFGTSSTLPSNRF